jgi:SPP1 family predicted phage head-tail adaptor
MARIITKRKRINKIDIGSMNSRIRIFTRSISAPLNETNVNYGESFQKYLDVWAAVDTPKGIAVFDATNTLRDVTHNFYIRFLPGVTFEKWILYKNNYYDLLSVVNMEEESKFYMLMCNLRGDQSMPVNLA